MDTCMVKNQSVAGQSDGFIRTLPALNRPFDIDLYIVEAAHPSLSYLVCGLSFDRKRS